jgi:hypothetical protein
LLPVVEELTQERMLVSPTSAVTTPEAGFEPTTVVVESDSYETCATRPL